MCDKSTGSLKYALTCFVSMLKSISFVFKWKNVVSMLLPLSLKSYGGSQIRLQRSKVPCAGSAVYQEKLISPGYFLSRK